MTSADAYLKELQHAELAQGQSKLRTLATKYRFHLARLPQFNQEIETLLMPESGVDYSDLAAEVEAALAQANEFLMALDLAPVDYPDQPELSPYGQGLANIMTSQTVTALATRFQQKCVAGQLAVEKGRVDEKKRLEAQAASARKTKANAAAAQQKAKEQAQAAQARRDTLARFGYIDHDDGTVTDTKKKLMWKQCAEGQSGPDCAGNVLRYPWATAMKISETLNLRGGFAGHHDWRVPTKDELETLVFPGQCPTICLDAFPNAPDVTFWSSSEDGSCSAWDVNFNNGGVNSGYDCDSSYAVRLVRSSQ